MYRVRRADGHACDSAGNSAFFPQHKHTHTQARTPHTHTHTHTHTHNYTHVRVCDSDDVFEQSESAFLAPYTSWCAPPHLLVHLLLAVGLAETVEVAERLEEA